MNSINDVESYFHCQFQCQMNLDCYAFTFDKRSLICYLKDSLGCNETNINRISGPKICGYMAGKVNYFCQNGSQRIFEGNFSYCFLTELDKLSLIAMKEFVRVIYNLNFC